MLLYILVLVYYTACVYRSRSDATDAISKIAYMHGRTNTAAALSYMYNVMFQGGRGDRDYAPNIVVILTDGVSNNRKDTQKEAYKVRTDASRDTCCCLVASENGKDFLKVNKYQMKWNEMN